MMTCLQEAVVPKSSAACAPDRVAGGPAMSHPMRPIPRRRAGLSAAVANAALAQLPLAVAVIAADLRLLYWNEPAANLFGVPSLMAADTPLLAGTLAGIANLTQPQRERIIAFVTDQIATLDRGEPDCCLRMLLGRERRFVLKVRGLGCGRWMLLIDDGAMTAVSSQNGAAPGDAWLDALTGLSNRRRVNEVLRNLTTNATPENHVAMLIIDLDRFKPINDTLGHSVGDAMLYLAAQRLRRETRDEDLLGRLGGDEFVILLPDGGHAEALAARVVDVMSRPFLVEGHIATIGASVGIARFPDHAMSADRLLRHADTALYSAKRAGGGTWRMFEPTMAAATHTRRALEMDLRKALTLGELSLVYQPRLTIRTQSLSGFEALPHWNHPTRGIVSASEFIPVAETIGCIAAMNEWVLKTACMDVAGWPVPLPVAVRVSARQIEDGERLFRAIQAALRESGLAAVRLELEITDRSLLSQDEPLMRTLRRLHEVGVRIAMDDFGTGMSTTAQGVHTLEQATLAETSLCTDIQGDVGSAPVPASDIDSLIGRYFPKPVAVKR
jgi:diguanylate cyclase (GGDEF)-like protein